MIDLKGESDETLYVSVLLHGNEHAGYLALQKWLPPYLSGQKKLSRNLLIFIGNVEAASYNQRYLSNQKDYNRVWDKGESPEHQMAQQILAELNKRSLLACIDIHNNTGRNPHYTVIHQNDPKHYGLAKLFGPQTVYFTSPQSAFSVAASKSAPSIALECGLSHEISGIDHAVNFLERCLNIPEIPDHEGGEADLEVFETFCRIKLPQPLEFYFSDESAAENHTQVIFRKDLDMLNFKSLPAGSELGETMGQTQFSFLFDFNKQPVPDSFFCYDNQTIRTRVDLIPAMFTRDKEAIRKDCFGYLMRKKIFS